MSELRFDPSQLDKIIHSPIRLGILAALYSGGEECFTHLRKVVGATDGNLTIQMKHLEENGLIRVTKKFIDRRPRTTYRLTEKGKKAFRGYLSHMATLMKDCGMDIQ